MFNWHEAFDDVKKRMTELENRITIVRGELQRARREADQARAQRLLAVREQELERAKVYIELSSTNSQRAHSRYPGPEWKASSITDPHVMKQAVIDHGGRRRITWP